MEREESRREAEGRMVQQALERGCVAEDQDQEEGEWEEEEEEESQSFYSQDEQEERQVGGTEMRRLAPYQLHFDAFNFEAEFLYLGNNPADPVPFTPRASDEGHKKEAEEGIRTSWGSTPPSSRASREFAILQHPHPRRPQQYDFSSALSYRSTASSGSSESPRPDRAIEEEERELKQFHLDSPSTCSSLSSASSSGEEEEGSASTGLGIEGIWV